MTRWRKRPVVIEAIQWTGENFAAVKDFVSGALGAGEVMGGALPLWVVKSQALCHVQRGDWIIREADGSGFYPCAADVFAVTYEPAETAERDSGEPGGARPGDDTSQPVTRAQDGSRERTGAVEALPVGAGSDRATTPAEAFRADLAALREQVEAALDRSIDRCARCKVCDTQINAVMAAVGAEFDRMHAAMEHAESAAAGSHEGMRLWMLDCGELVAKHRERAEAAERKLAEIEAHCREHAYGVPLAGILVPAADIAAIIGTDAEGGALDASGFDCPAI